MNPLPRNGGSAPPLAGVRVVELSSSVMGPYAAMIMAQLGASVVKVEPPGGDTTRSLGPARTPGMAGIFLSLNAGKQSVELDVRSASGKADMRRLLAQADVFLHNLRPASADRLGLGYAIVSGWNPKIVYCALTGYGSAGRYAGRPAYDDIIQAMCGLAALQGHRDGVPKYVTSVVADKVSGLTAAYAVLAALFARERTGRGEAIEVPMFETMAAFTLLEQLAGSTFEPPLGPPVYGRTVSPYRRPHRTTDGYLAMAVYTDRQWRSLLERAGHAHLIEDPRFASLSARTEHIDEVYGFLDALLGEKPTAEWLAIFEELDIPAAPVKSTADLLEDPHLSEVGLFATVEHPSEGAIRTVRNPVFFSNVDLPELAGAPDLGRDNDQVLGRSAAENRSSP